MAYEEFAFLRPGVLSDGEITLALTGTYPASLSKRYVPYYSFGIQNAKTWERMGEITFRVAGREAMYLCGHIGYSVFLEHRGHHYAEKACRLLFPFARRHGMATVIITCNPENLASKRTCERVGGKLLEIADVPVGSDLYLQGDIRKCVFEVDVRGYGKGNGL